jgi:hypothetical protein
MKPAAQNGELCNDGKKEKTPVKMQFQVCIMHKSNFLCVHQHRREFKISFPLFIAESFSSSAIETKNFLKHPV